jgi:hypothetical protein
MFTMSRPSTINYFTKLPSDSNTVKAIKLLYLINVLNINVGQCKGESSTYRHQGWEIYENSERSPYPEFAKFKILNDISHPQAEIAICKDGITIFHKFEKDVTTDELLEFLNKEEFLLASYNTDLYNPVDLHDYLGFRINPKDIEYGSESPKELVKYVLEKTALSAVDCSE